MKRISLSVVAVATLALYACGSDGGSSVEVSPTELTKVMEEVRDGYTYVLYSARQPAYRDRASTAYVDQRVEVAIHDGVEMDAPVIVLVDGEAPLFEGYLNIPKRLITPVIYVQIEHRGYGQSLSDATDQTVPDYVSGSEAVFDAHGVVNKLSETFTGPWFAYGISYSGGLVVEYAGRFPDDLAGVVSSCGVLDAPLQNTAYDPYTRERLGEETYAQLIDHMNNLEPAAPFDDTWIDREFLQGIIIGLTQYSSFQSLVPAIQGLVARLPTQDLIVDVRALDQAFADGDAADFGESRALRTVTREEALEREPGWRVYLWQQCTDIGIFSGSAEEESVWQKTEEDLRQECREMFDAELNTEPNARRPFLADMESAGVPLVFVSGGNDPWSPVGLAVPPASDRIDQQERWSVYQTTYGRHVHVPEGFHNPEAGDVELARTIFDAVFELGGVESE